MSIDRVSTALLSQTGVGDILRAQREIGDLQRQIGTQRKAEDVQGFGIASQRIISVRVMLVKAEAFASSADELGVRMSLQNQALDQVSEAGAALREKLTTALGLETGVEIATDLNIAFQQAVAALNLTHGGVSVFGGERTDSDPVTISTLSDLGALASADLAFGNSDRPQRVRLDDRTLVDAAPLAKDVGTELFASFKRIQDFLSGPNGPFTTPLTAAQKSFLESEIGLLSQANSSVTQALSIHGANQARVEQSAERQRGQATLLEQIVGQETEADLAEAAAKLNSAQLQLEASASVFTRLQGLSLLNFLT